MTPPLPPATLAALALVVTAAFAVETALGFGATLVAVALGSFLAPIETILPAFLPLNVVLSGYVAARYRRDVDRGMLFRRIVPLMGLGMPVGVLLFRSLGSSRLRLAFGVFVIALSALELGRPRPPDGAATRPLDPVVAGALLFAAGVIHGVFATGGPLTVYVTGRALADKARFRATLSALWLVLNLALLASYAAGGQLGAGSATLSAVLVAPLGLGMALGERAHRRVPEALFRTLVFTLLLVAGTLLTGRALR